MIERHRDRDQEHELYCKAVNPDTRSLFLTSSRLPHQFLLTSFLLAVTSLFRVERAKLRLAWL
jgi:hypothetical protein